MPKSPQIVAIGLLTQGDLDALGQGFDRAFPLDDELVFEDLLQAIDEAERALILAESAPMPPAGEAETRR